MGMHDSAAVTAKVERSTTEARHADTTNRNWILYLTLLLISASIYLVGAISPPSLMDDVDSVQAQIARNMLSSGDWVTARLDGIAYLEKALVKPEVISIYRPGARLGVVSKAFDIAARLSNTHFQRPFLQTPV